MKIIVFIVEKISEKLTSVISWYTNLNPIVHKLIIFLVGLLASIAPILTIVKFIKVVVDYVPII